MDRPSPVSLSKSPTGFPLASVKLSDAVVDDVASEDSGPKWVQVATEGTYLGYQGGAAGFTFSRSTFEQVKANVRNHPAFKAGADGVGCSQVIPWDFEHASTFAPSDGVIPERGVPSQGWTYDFDVRNGADGKAQLWALTEFLEPARGYVKARQYQWASVVLAFNSVDPVSGKETGARVVSIALTNTPFIEGMERLVASATAAGKVGLRYWDTAESPDEAISKLKQLLGLPEISDVSAVIQNLTQVQEFLSGVLPAPQGVDLGEIAKGIRQILNLQALTNDLDTVRVAIEQMTKITADPETSPPPALSQNTGSKPAGNSVSLTSSGGGTMEEFIKKLSAMLGVLATENEVLEAIRDGVELRKQAAEKLSLRKKSTEEIVLAAGEAMGAKEKLGALLTALGVEDPEAGVAQIVDLISKADQLKTVMPELEGLRADAAAAEDAQAEADVEEAMASRKLPENMKPALVLFRKEKPKEFAEQFPRITAAQAALTANVATTATGAPKRVAASVQGGSSEPQRPEGAVDISGFAGASTTSKAVEYVKANKLAGDVYDDQFKLARRLVREGRLYEPTEIAG